MKVRRVKYVSGSGKWQLDYGLVSQPDGSRRRKQVYFATRDEAQAVMVAEKARRQRHGDSALALPEAVRIRFLAAEEKLAAAGGTIEAAVELFCRQAKALREPIELEKMLKLCLADKERLGKSVRYLQQLKCSCLNFIRGRESQLSHTVAREELEKWVHGNGWKAKTQKVYMGDLRAFFSWGVAKGHLAENPVNAGGAIELAEPEEAEITKLRCAEVSRLLRFCIRGPARGREDFRSLLWYLVLGLFAGIRPKELERMRREQVSLEDGHVVVEANQAKTRKRRAVDLSPEAVRWLALDLRRTGKIIPVNFERRWGRFRAAAGVMPWPHDAMRHTFASMHYAQHQNESVLKAQMGHSDAEDTLMQHYRALATRREARVFWGLSPSRRRVAVEVCARGKRREAPPSYGYWKRIRAGGDEHPPVGHTPR